MGSPADLDEKLERSSDTPLGTTAISNWATLRFLVGGHRRAIVALGFTSVVSAIAEAGILAVIAQVAAALLADSGNVSTTIGPLSADLSVGALLGIAGGLVLARITLQALISFLQARIGASVQADLRNNLFAAFTRASWNVQARDAEGHLQEMLTSQALQATWGTLQISTLISAGFTFLVLILSAMLLNVVAAAIVVVVAVVLFGVLRPLTALGQRRAKELSHSQMDYASGVGEAVRMAEESHVFGVQASQRERIEALANTARDLLFRTQLINRAIPNLYQSLIYLTVVGGLALLYASNSGPVASLGAVVLLLVRAGSYGQQLQTAYQQVRQALPFVERLQSATLRYAASHRLAGSRRLSKIDRLAFDHVGYAYRTGEHVLTDISFEAPRNEAVGIIGPSGAGKSTLVQLLLQLRQPDQGSYLINGVPAAEFDSADWHRHVAYVPQEPRLLHASVADNIRYYREIDDASIERACELARIDEDIISWANGYETIIGPRADAISGGQRQRISLARALAARPSLLVLDEPTSALDPRSESLIQTSLGELSEEILTFIVTHRMSTLAVCDRVMIIADGRIDAFDSTDVLNRTNSYFGAAAAFNAGPRREANIGLLPE